MSNSEFEAFVPLQELSTNENRPFAASVSRAILNNAAHLGDESTQVRAKWVAPSDDSGTDTITYPNFTSDVADETPVMMFNSLIPITIGPDGRAVTLRVRLAGSASNGTASIKLHMVFGSDIRADFPGQSNDGVFTVATASSTNQWIGGFGTTLTIPTRITDAATKLTSTIDGIGGDPATVVETLLAFSIWGESADASTDEPILAGYQVEEYIGA